MPPCAQREVSSNRSMLNLSLMQTKTLPVSHLEMIIRRGKMQQNETVMVMAVKEIIEQHVFVFFTLLY